MDPLGRWVYNDRMRHYVARETAETRQNVRRALGYRHHEICVAIGTPHHARNGA
jgi:hypothetical protein